MLFRSINGNYGEGFSYCRNLTEIIIPDEIKQIEFDWCSFKDTHLTLKTQAKLKELEPMDWTDPVPPTMSLAYLSARAQNE